MTQPTPSEPDWTALPENPWRFFGLPADFDRIGLRRKYSALIRRFKPEKYPDEFQRIRAAFEDIDQQLRVSQRQPQHPRPVPSFHNPSDADRSDTQQPLESTDAKPPERPTRCPIVARSSETPEQLAESLRGLAHHLRNDHFYAEAWPLWEELTAVEPFERWQPLLAELSEIVDIDDYDQPPVEKVEFFIRFLRRALWIAPDDWLFEAFNFLDDNADLVREPSEHEFLLQLDAYHEDRADFLDGTRGRQIIDKAIHDYCWKSAGNADEAFRRHQAEIAAHPEWLRESFPVGNDDMESHWRMWVWISQQVAENLRLDNSTSATSRHSISKVFDRLAEVTRASKHFREWRRFDAWNKAGMNASGIIVTGLCGLGGFVVSAGACLVIYEILRFFGFNSELVMQFPFVVAAGVAIYSYRRVKRTLRAESPTPIDSYERRREYHLGRKCYDELWAPLLLDFVRTTRIPFGQLVELLTREAENNRAASLDQGNPFVRWVHHFTASDYALACFSISLPFVR